MKISEKYLNKANNEDINIIYIYMILKKLTIHFRNKCIIGTLSTLAALSNNTKAKPRDLPVAGSVFRLHSSTVPNLEK